MFPIGTSWSTTVHLSIPAMLRKTTIAFNRIKLFTGAVMQGLLFGQSVLTLANTSCAAEQ